MSRWVMVFVSAVLVGSLFGSSCTNMPGPGNMNTNENDNGNDNTSNGPHALKIQPPRAAPIGRSMTCPTKLLEAVAHSLHDSDGGTRRQGHPAARIGSQTAVGMDGFREFARCNGCLSSRQAT